jgi:hypothetical protein
MIENSVSTIPETQSQLIHVSREESFTWLNLRDPYLGVDELAQQRASERPYGVLGCTVNTTGCIRLTASYRAKVDDVTGVSFLEICKYGNHETRYILALRLSTHR